jgi:hypothetical protein
MEIGSYLELDINKTGEWYSGTNNIARLNSARAGIYHAFRLLDCSVLYLPYYICPTVTKFLESKGVVLKRYSINEKFEPQVTHIEVNACIVMVNYFGILSSKFLAKYVNLFEKVIIDNGPAFFNPPLEGCYSVYSSRKFFGVPDGCYVIGNQAEKYTEEYKNDFSSETSLFLFKRHEVGSGAAYEDRMKNENRIDSSDILNMSKLTHTLLKGINYDSIKRSRRSNFDFCLKQYEHLNLLDVGMHLDESCVPMVYPLVIEQKNLMEKLRERQIFTGRWWNHVLNEVEPNTFEAWLSNYMLPLPVDQRYPSVELELVFSELTNVLGI